MAFLLLLFELVAKIADRMKLSFLLPIVTVCTSAVLLAANIPAIGQLINFAVTYYPA